MPVLVGYLVAGRRASIGRRARARARRTTLPGRRSCRCSRSSTTSRSARPARSTAPPCPGRCPVSDAATSRAARAPRRGSPSSGRRVLGIRSRSRDADFFELGGGSLAAAQLVSRIRAARPRVHDGRRLRPPAPRRDGRRARGARRPSSTTASDTFRAAEPDAAGHAVGADARRRAAVHPDAACGGSLYLLTASCDPARCAPGSNSCRRRRCGCSSSASSLFATPFGRMAIAVAVARLLLAGLRAGRLSARRRGAPAPVARRAGRPPGRRGRARRRARGSSYYARALGAKIGADVDLHTLPPVTGMLDDRRRRRDRARGRPRRATGSTATSCASAASASARARRSAPAARSLPGTRIGQRRRDRARARPSSVACRARPALGGLAGRAGRRHSSRSRPERAARAARAGSWAYGASSLRLSACCRSLAFAAGGAGRRRGHPRRRARSARPSLRALAWLVPGHARRRRRRSPGSS